MLKEPAPLSPDLARELFSYDPDTGRLRWRKRIGHCGANSFAGTTRYGRVKIEYRDEIYRAEWIVWLMHRGEWCTNIGHHDNRCDNTRIENLYRRSSLDPRQTKLIKERARRNGEKLYWTGVPCPHGHVAHRFLSNNNCSVCVLERHRRRRADPKQLEKERACQALYYQRHREQVLQRGRLYRQSNREKIRVQVRNRHARKRSAVGAHTAQDVRNILETQGWRCAYCHASLRKRKYHIDHIEPLGRGGSNTRRNLQALCQSCNCRKHAKDPIEFARQIGLLL